MAGYLLFVILIYSFHEIKAQALLRPKLTVNPQVITETDSVTLNCQTPSSVSVTECYFRTRIKPAIGFPCLKTLTGTELLKITNKSLPAEVKVTCFYLSMYQSPDSDVSSIIIRTSLPPKLTLNPQMITETDSVTLTCQTPPSVSVTQCYFYTLSGGTVRIPSCLQTLTGTELLQMAHQRSPAEVKVICFYTVKLGETDYPSPHSETSSITIHSQKPQISLQHFDGEYVLFTCSLPGSANHDTRCNLYFGEATHPVTTTIWKKRTSEKRWFCQFTVTIDDLLRHLHFVLRKDASCDYTLGSEPNSLSPRSDRRSLTYIVEIESSKMWTTLTMTTGLTVNTPRASTPLTPTKSTSGWTVGSSTVSSSFTFPTSVKPTSGSSVSKPGTVDSPFPETPTKTASGTRILKAVAVVAGCGVTVGIICLVSVIVWSQRRAGSEEVKTREPQTENSDIYNIYCEISEEATALALKDVTYSTVKAH